MATNCILTVKLPQGRWDDMVRLVQMALEARLEVSVNFYQEDEING